MLLPTTKDWTNEASCELENLEPAKDTAPESTGLEQRDKLKITFNKNTVPARVCKPNLLQSLFGDDDNEDLKVPLEPQSEKAQELTSIKQEKNCSPEKGNHFQQCCKV
jgi:hypothetical protein